MYKDLVYSVAEFMFTIMGGVPLIGSVLILLWIASLSLLAVSPVVLMLRTPVGQKNKQWLVLLYGVIIFPLSFVIALGVPVAQDHMLADCKQEIVTIESEDFIIEKTVRVCRYRNNYYDDTPNSLIIHAC